MNLTEARGIVERAFSKEMNFRAGPWNTTVDMQRTDDGLWDITVVIDGAGTRRGAKANWVQAQDISDADATRLVDAFDGAAAVIKGYVQQGMR
jgi:hypothetical protein